MFNCERLTKVRKECTKWLNAISKAEITFFFKHSLQPPLHRAPAALYVLSQKHSTYGSAPSAGIWDRKKGITVCILNFMWLFSLTHWPCDKYIPSLYLQRIHTGSISNLSEQWCREHTSAESRLWNLSLQNCKQVFVRHSPL